MEEVRLQMFKNGAPIAKKELHFRGNRRIENRRYERESEIREFVLGTKLKGNFLVQVSEFHGDDKSDRVYVYKVSVSEGEVVNEYRVVTLIARRKPRHLLTQLVVKKNSVPCLRMNGMVFHMN